MVVTALDPTRERQSAIGVAGVTTILGMDLVKMLTSVEFTEVRRGLDRDEVSAFLHEVAGAVAALERRCADANARAERAEAKAIELADDTSLRRTLVLAQRTADAAIAEAQDEARRTVVEAEERAAERMAEADAHSERTRSSAEEAAANAVQSAQARANQLLVEAKTEARRASEDLRAKLRQEVLELETARDVLLRDVALFEAHMGEQRTRVQGALGALQMVLDHPDALRKMSIPTITPVSVPVAVITDDALDAAANDAAASMPTAAAAVSSVSSTMASSASTSNSGSAMMGSRRPTEAPADGDVLSSRSKPGIRPARSARRDDRDLVIDLVDRPGDHSAGALVDETGEVPREMSSVTAERSAVNSAGPSADDDELVKTFFEQSTFADERWKPRKERDRDKDRKRP